MSALSADQKAQYVDKFARFLNRNARDGIGQILDEEDNRILWLDWQQLFRYNADLAEDYLSTPDLEDALTNAINEVPTPFEIPTEELRVAVYNLPSGRQFTVGSFPEPEQYIGEYVSLTGQVSKITEAKPSLEVGEFECQRCGTFTEIPQGSDRLYEPHECKGCERQGPFELNKAASEWTRRQIARLEQPPEDITTGQGARMEVLLEGPLTDTIDAGDRVDMVGLLRVKQQDDDTPIFDTYIQAKAPVVQETDYEEIEIDDETEQEIKAYAAGEHGDPYEAGMDSIAPKIHGNDDVKLALLLQLFSGWPHEQPDGTTDRGDFHVLLIGDPGCGKSDMLRAVEELAPRSTYSSGKGMSAAGATAAAVQDDFGDNKWSLEAGALVKANNGVACIDEIDKVKEDAVSSLHDALESQRVTVNKAGINTSLPAETSLLAAGNPEYGRFDSYQPIAQQIDLAPTLISRFDLIFTMQDKPDEERDTKIGETIVENRYITGRHQRGDDVGDDELEQIEPEIDAELLRAYIAYARKNCHPVFANEAVMEELVDIYVNLRLSNSNDEADEDGPVPVTARKIEALIRLCEASARVRLSDQIQMSDVNRVKQLVLSTMEDVGVDPESGDFDADIVRTNNSNTQRKRIQEIVKIVVMLEQEYDPGAPYEEVIDEAAEKGHKQSKVEHAIENLRQKGRLYEPQSDHLRVVKD